MIKYGREVALNLSGGNQIPKSSTLTYYSLFEIADFMEKEGHIKKREFIREYAIQWGLPNDAYFWLGFDYYSHTDKQEKYKEYFDALKEYLGLPQDTKGIDVSSSH